LKKIDTPFTETALTILQKRYLNRDDSDKLLETPDDMFRRVAKKVASAETVDEQKSFEKKFYEIMARLDFLPNSPTLKHAGLTTGTYFGCFYIDIFDNRESIFEVLKESVIINAMGGGIGYNFSNIRPEGDIIKSTGGRASGPISFAKIFDLTLGEVIAQGGFRFGAQMGLLSIHHPDIEKFISCKREEGILKSFNISVAMTNDFMQRVLAGEPFEHELIFEGKVYKIIDGLDLWRKIVEGAWRNGEPGLFFIDVVNEKNLLKGYEHINGCNPCQPYDTPIITQNGVIKLGDVKVGDKIWSSEGWTTVINKINSGKKEVFKYNTTAGSFYSTGCHKIVCNGNKIEISKATGIDVLEGVHNPKIVKLDPQDIVDGLVIGDGTKQARGTYMTLCIGRDDKEYFTSEISDFIKNKDRIKDYRYGTKTTLSIDELPRTYERFVPERFRFATFDKIAGFLRGLYSANGDIIRERVCLRATSPKIVEHVQQMLSSLGIRSYVTTDKEKDVKFKNGTYTCKQSYKINIINDVDKFYKYIGFIQTNKLEKLKKVVNKRNVKQQKINKSKTTYDIQNSESQGEMDVFDITVDNDSHTYWSYGFNTSNCGEMPLTSYGSCVLGSINLSNHLKDNVFDYEKLKDTIITSVRFLDNLIEVNNYPLEKIEKETKKYRKIGLGVMGFADTLINLGISYESDEAISLARDIMSFVSEEAIKVSEELGRLKGTTIFGRRNGLLTTVAPTGSISLIAGCSGGIEPIFSFKYDKRCVGTKLTILHPLVEKYCEDNKCSFEDLPNYFIEARNVSIESHINMQAAFQEFTHNSISKTINAPNSATQDDIDNAFKQAFNKGCKGITVYRDGSREEEAQTALTTESVEQTTENVEMKWTGRPDMLPGITHKVKTGDGTVYLTLNHFLTEEQVSQIKKILSKSPIVEVFAAVGKSGRSMQAMAEWATRGYSLALQNGASVKDVEKQSRGIFGENVTWSGGTIIRSIPDAFSKVLKGEYPIYFENEKPIMKKQDFSSPLCPDCGSILEIAEGCKGGKCNFCGYSKC